MNLTVLTHWETLTNFVGFHPLPRFRAYLGASTPWFGAGCGRHAGFPTPPDRLISVLPCAAPSPVSVDNRRQKCPLRFVVETHTHEREGLHHAETVRQTPAEQLPIARRQEKSWPHELCGGTDERLDLGVALAHGMAREPYDGGIAGETVLVLDNARCATRDGLQEFSTAVMAMDATTQRIASLRSPSVAGRTA